MTARKRVAPRSSGLVCHDYKTMAATSTAPSTAQQIALRALRRTQYPVAAPETKGRTGPSAGPGGRFGEDFQEIHEAWY